MRDPMRVRKILGEIHKIWKTYPDMRFGQLIINLYTVYAKEHGLPVRPLEEVRIYGIEDDEFYEWLLKFEGF